MLGNKTAWISKVWAEKILWADNCDTMYPGKFNEK